MGVPQTMYRNDRNRRQLFFQYSCPSGCDTSKLLSDGLKNKLYYDCFQKVLYHYPHQTKKIQTFSRKRRVRIFCFWRCAHRTTKASAAHDRAASAQAQYAADAYFFAVPPLRMGESGHRLRFDVICRNTPAFLAPLCRATVEQSEIERFYPTSFLYALRTLLREMDLSGANWSLLFQSMMPASTHHCAALAVSGSATSTKAGVPMG